MKKRHLTATHVIMLGFFIGAIVGSVLLFLPFSLKAGVRIDYIDALFVSVSSICVTGLSTLNVGETFSLLGQGVLLVLIQMGGLGVVTFTTLVFIAFQKKITLADMLLIQSAYNLDTFTGLIRLTFRIIKVTICIEVIGALLYAIVFVPQYGVIGVWYAIFHSVSAFCNAGLDLLGGNSFCVYRDNVIVNFTTICLIIAGGLGFPVYWEIGRFFKSKQKGSSDSRKMSFHSKLVISVTAILVVGGMLLILLLEFNNPQTLGGLSIPEKFMAALFQSVTLRTAGFATIDQSAFTSASCLLFMILMFIGGSPAGTAGGVKTITIALLFASVMSNIRGKKDVSIMNRRVTDTVIRRCVAIIVVSLTTLLVLTGVLMAVNQYDFLDTMYEMTSAIATVGLSRGMTGELNTIGKLIIALTMYLGRIGPITLALAFNLNKGTPSVTHAEGKVIIG